MTFTPISFLLPDPCEAADALPTTSSCRGGERTPGSPVTAALLALRCYKSFPFLLPRAIFHPCKRPQIYIDGVMSKHNSISKLSRSMSCVITVTTVQLRFIFHPGPPSQPHLMIRLKYYCQGKVDSLSQMLWSPPRLPWKPCALLAPAARGGPR